MGIELQYIRTFYIVGMTKSFTKAAGHLHLTQPAISHQIKMLEENLHAKLFERSKKALVLTEVGKQLLKGTRSILDLVERIEVELEGYQTSIKGAIKIGCPYELGTHWLAPRVTQFMKKYKDVTFDIQLGHPNDIPQLLFNYNVDMTIGLMQLNANEVESKVIYEESLVCVSSTQHQLASKGSITVDQLSSEQFLIYEHEDFNAFTWLKAHKLKNKLKVSLVCNSYQAIKTWLLQNNGLAIMPLQSVEKEIEKGLLKPLYLEGHNDVQVINNVYLSGYGDTLKILKFRTFADFLKQTTI